MYETDFFVFITYKNSKHRAQHSSSRKITKRYNSSEYIINVFPQLN